MRRVASRSNGWMKGTTVTGGATSSPGGVGAAAGAGAGSAGAGVAPERGGAVSAGAASSSAKGTDHLVARVIAGILMYLAPVYACSALAASDAPPDVPFLRVTAHRLFRQRIGEFHHQHIVEVLRRSITPPPQHHHPQRHA